MAAISWKTAVNGDWNVAANWSTDTIPTFADTVTISLSGPYIVTISSPDQASTLTFNASQAALLENAGTLELPGGLTVLSGFVSLNEANAIGSVLLAGGVLAFGNAFALGGGTITVFSGELLSAANETLSNPISFSTTGATVTFAAAHGKTLNLTGNVTFQGNNTVIIGAPGQDGDVIWSGTSSAQAGEAFDVLDGTLTASNFELGSLLGLFGATIAAGATLDWAGNLAAIKTLQGAGTVTDSGAATTLTISQAVFSGVISGPQSLVIGSALSSVLSGDNTYTGNTTINSGSIVQLGAGGATGSIGGGAISDGGRLAINRSNAVTLTNAISGAGTLFQVGTGVTSINTANTYTGGTSVEAGTLAIGNAGALGTGGLEFTGGELLGTATETFANPIAFSAIGITTTFAAAHGTTLNLTGGVTFDGDTVDIGAPGQDGDVIWSGAASGTIGGSTFDVLDGTLTAGNASNLELLLGSVSQTTIAAGATLDWAGNLARIDNLQGAGAVTNSGTPQSMFFLGPTNFSGTISGALLPVFEGNATLSGLEDYSGGATLSGPVTVANTGTYDIVTNAGIAGTPASFFINNGLFEKTGGGGVSDVTSGFVNNDLITVSSGSIQFSGGFTNNGVIHGIVSQSGGVTTISAGTPNDFNADSISDVLWRNTSDDSLVTWLMNGSAVGSGTYVTSQGSSIAPDSSWSVAGIGDFNGDGDADVLWRQSSTGAVVDWSMNGSVVETGTELTYQGTALSPDSSWSVAGIGDFNGDGAADILWRQSTTGSLVTWLMNGSTISSDTDVTLGGSALAPDSSWSVAGIGDFNGDGHADILWRQSTTGTLTEWQMNGSQVASSNFVMSQGNPITPDSSWSVVGIGDCNGDGNADILWRQGTTGTLVDWSMSGPTVETGVVLTYQGNAIDPDATWNVVEVGDFNGTNQAGILWQQSTTGSLVEWQMNGAQIVSSNIVTSQGNTIAPPSSFQVQGSPTDFA